MKHVETSTTAARILEKLDWLKIDGISMEDYGHNPEWDKYLNFGYMLSSAQKRQVLRLRFEGHRIVWNRESDEIFRRVFCPGAPYATTGTASMTSSLTLLANLQPTLFPRLKELVLGVVTVSCSALIALIAAQPKLEEIELLSTVLLSQPLCCWCDVFAAIPHLLKQVE